MDMDNNVEIDYGTGGRRGKVGQKWKNWDSYNRITIKKEKKKRIVYHNAILLG